MAKKFPEVTGIEFYLSLRSNYIHMGLHLLLYSIRNYPDFIEEVNKFLTKNRDPRFDLVHPQLVLTKNWKFDYIFLRKIKNKNNGKKTNDCNELCPTLCTAKFTLVRGRWTQDVVRPREVPRFIKRHRQRFFRNKSYKFRYHTQRKQRGSSSKGTFKTISNCKWKASLSLSCR